MSKIKSLYAGFELSDLTRNVVSETTTLPTDTPKLSASVWASPWTLGRAENIITRHNFLARIQKCQLFLNQKTVHLSFEELHILCDFCTQD